MEATLVKWGNSQGIRISKEICDELGIRIGDVAHLSVLGEKRRLIVEFSSAPDEGYRRSRKMSLAEFAGDWQGEKVGEEWAVSDVGAEEVA